MANKKEFTGKMERSLKGLGSKIDSLLEIAHKSAGKARVKARAESEKLLYKSWFVKAKLNELKRAGSAGYDEAKVGFNSAWKDLSEAFKRASKKFKETK